MNWFYILIRTFPFWAIPTGIAFLTTGFSKKGKLKWIVLGLILVVSGVAFFFYQGHFRAVPLVNEMINGGNR